MTDVNIYAASVADLGTIDCPEQNIHVNLLYWYCTDSEQTNDSSLLVSCSTIRVLCAGRVLADRTQLQTHQGYREWTSLPLPPPLPPPAHLAMRMLPATRRLSQSPPPHIWKPQTQLRPNGSSLQLRPGQLSVSILGDSMSCGELWICHRPFIVIPSACAERTLGPAPAAILQSDWGGGAGQCWRRN